MYGIGANTDITINSMTQVSKEFTLCEKLLLFLYGVFEIIHTLGPKESVLYQIFVVLWLSECNSVLASGVFVQCFSQALPHTTGMLVMTWLQTMFSLDPTYNTNTPHLHHITLFFIWQRLSHSKLRTLCIYYKSRATRVLVGYVIVETIAELKNMSPLIFEPTTFR